jgi:hypothetical protein
MTLRLLVDQSRPTHQYLPTHPAGAPCRSGQ